MSKTSDLKALIKVKELGQKYLFKHKFEDLESLLITVAGKRGLDKYLLEELPQPPEVKG